MGFMAPLIGTWRAEQDDTPMGRVVCTRRYERILGGKFISLTADWDVGDGAKTYTEIANYGLNRDGIPAFWSFTSDGGTSQGIAAEVTDLDPRAAGFEANMPSGLARFAIWPDGDDMIWAAEARTAKGWSRMVTHRCIRTE